MEVSTSQFQCPTGFWPTTGLIGLVTPVKKGQKLLLVNLKTEESIQCSVMSVYGSKAGKPLVGFAFDQRSPRYWGLVFPPEDWDPVNRKRPEQ